MEVRYSSETIRTIAESLQGKVKFLRSRGSTVLPLVTYEDSIIDPGNVDEFDTLLTISLIDASKKLRIYVINDLDDLMVTIVSSHENSHMGTIKLRLWNSSEYKHKTVYRGTLLAIAVVE